MIKYLTLGQSDPYKRDRIGLFVILLPVVVAIFLTVMTEGFATATNFYNLIPQGTPLLILSLGLMFPVLTGGIDISNGALVSVVAAFMVTFDQSIGVTLGFVVALLTGLANGLGVTLFRVHPIVMTLGVMIIFSGATPLILPDAAGMVETFLADLARGSILSLPVALIWCVLAIGIAWLLIARSELGVRIYAVGANEHAVWLSGVNTRKVIVICYVLSALSAYVAALFIVGRVGSATSNIGDPLILNSITAVAIGGVLLSGGVGSVLGVVLGVISLTFINNGMNQLAIDPFLQRVVTGVILLTAIGFQRREEIGV